ncbi:helix-turn-helix transcriptional regulator [Candidatus Woesearchaeota archaeon]|nr:helix-turn-helix transcriptional regulator [archaeon]MBT5022009.1 helix-turn-helix transcriptional regulator [Candidatus Woesearchaeota archaeon]
MENMAKEITIGKNIKKLRNKLGLSQEEFAQKSGVKYTTLTKIESSVIKKPSVMVMDQIAKALGVSIEDLIK